MLKDVLTPTTPRPDERGQWCVVCERRLVNPCDETTRRWFRVRGYNITHPRIWAAEYVTILVAVCSRCDEDKGKGNKNV